MFQNKKHLFYVNIFLVMTFLTAGCVKSKKPVDPVNPVDPVEPVEPVEPIVNPKFDLTETGIDFTPVLDCIGHISSKMINIQYDARQRITAYTREVACDNTGQSYSLDYSNFTYDGTNCISYNEEMLYPKGKDIYRVFYRDIIYDDTGEKISYTAVLDGETFTYQK